VRGGHEHAGEVLVQAIGSILALDDVAIVDPARMQPTEHQPINDRSERLCWLLSLSTSV
jgi:hypothetical protein